MTKSILIFLAACASALLAQSPLTITTPNALPTATVNQSYAVQLSAAGGATPYSWHFQSGGNPSPRFNISSSGFLSGTPSSADLGVLTMAIQVTDATGFTVTKQFSFTVQTTQPLALTTTAFTPGVVGVAYSFQVAGTGGTPPYKWNVLPDVVTFPVPGEIAPGLILDSVTGQVTGTPSVAGSYGFTVTLADSAKGSVSAHYGLTISPGGPLGIVTASLPGGNVGAPYLWTLQANGGVPPYQWSVTTGSLPNGLSLNASTGSISGAPTTVGTTAFTVTVTDHAATPGTARQALSITVVVPPALIISTSSLPGGTQGAPYSQKLAATGGVPPYHWSVSTGTLPAGLNLGADTGIIDGTPSASGSSSFTIQAIDSAAGTAARATRALSIPITKLTQVSMSSNVLAPGTVNTPYSQVLQASGGAPPYRWSVIAGSLPPGLLLSGSGTISGVPSAAATFGFTVQVVDASGGSVIGAISVTFTAAPLSVVPVTLPSAMAGAPYPAQVLSATGGTPPYAFSIVGSLPSGMSLTNGSLGGTPGSAGTTSFTVKVTDAAQATATASQQIVVRSSLPVDLVLSTGSVFFSLAPGSGDVPEPQTFTVASGSVLTPLSYQVSVSPAAPWLSISGALNSTLSAPGFVTVSLSSQALALAAAGTPYTTSISINCVAPSACAGSSQKVNVSLLVGGQPPQLTLTSSFVALTSLSGTAAGSFGIQNSGGGTITVNSVSSPDSWLSIGDVPATLSPGPPTFLTVNGNPSGLTPGRLYRSTITVVTSAGTANLPVTLLVTSGLSMVLNPVGQQFQMAAGGAVGNPNGAVQVLVGGGVTANWTAATLPGATWLTLRTPSGTSTPTAPGTLSYSIDPAASAALAAGTYYGRIRITSSQVANTPQDLLVVLNVAPVGTLPDPDPQPSGLLFVANGNSSTSSQALTLYASSNTPVPYLASASTTTGVAWLTVTPTAGAASAGSPARPTVSVSAAGLPPGIYRGVVTYQFSASSLRSVNVTYIVPALTGGSSFFQSELSAGSLNPHATCAPSKVVATSTGLPSSFAQPAAWPTVLSIQLADDCGTAIGNGAVVVTFTNGDPPVGLTRDAASSGRYAATWVPHGPVAQVTVTASASAPGLAPAKVQITGKVTPNVAPALTPGGMLNVFNPLLAGGIAPGTAVQIYGSNLALPGVSALASSLPFPTSLSGTSVVIGGTPAPLYFVSPGQINALAPFELTPGVQYQVLVSVNGAITTPDSFVSAPGAPGIAAFANGAIIAQHLDGTLITDASPAKPGEIIVLYLAGLGSSANQPVTGSGAPNPPTDPVNPVTLTLNGKPAPTLFVGLTPGTVGLYQIDATVPDDTPDGPQTLTVSQAGAVSNTTILPVKK